MPLPSRYPAVHRIRSTGVQMRVAVSAITRSEPNQPSASRRPLLLTGEPQPLDELPQISVEHLLQRMGRVADPVIGHPALRIIVRADLRGAIAGADLKLPVPGARGFLLGDAEVEKSGSQHR